MKSKLLLIVILILSAVIRLVGLSRFPAGLNADEAALGYNAYSLLLTGKDEHNHPWPVNLESFGDFKPALYAYMLIPVIKTLGLTELAVRLPSAVFGVISVFLIYLFTNLIFENLYLIKNLKLKIGHLSALLLAINPWAIHFSRGAWETNVATTFIIFGVWSYLKFLETQKYRFLFLTPLFLSLSMYTYQSARILVPFLGLGLVILNFRAIFRLLIKLLVALIIFTSILLMPIAYSLISSDASSRFSGVGLIADEGPLNRVKEMRGQHSSFLLISRILHNRPVIYTIQFLKNYADHFSGNFLFINGDEIHRSKIPESGLFYLTDFVFMALGIIYFLRYPTSYSKYLWLWLIIAPIPAALTFQTPHALRAHNLQIPMIIFISAGLFWFIQFIKQHLKYKYLYIMPCAFLILLYSWQFSRFLHEYFVHYPQTYPEAWEYGFKELVTYVDSVQDKYSKILITDKYDQPYILFLFYSQYPPAKFQGNHQLTFRDKFNFSTVRDYSKYHFSSTSWDKVRDIHSALIVAAPEDIPGVGVNVIKTIYYPNSQPVFKIISN